MFQQNCFLFVHILNCINIICCLFYLSPLQTIQTEGFRFLFNERWTIFRVQDTRSKTLLSTFPPWSCQHICCLTGFVHRAIHGRQCGQQKCTSCMLSPLRLHVWEVGRIHIAINDVSVNNAQVQRPMGKSSYTCWKLAKLYSPLTWPEQLGMDSIARCLCMRKHHQYSCWKVLVSMSLHCYLHNEGSSKVLELVTK